MVVMRGLPLGVARGLAVLSCVKDSLSLDCFRSHTVNFKLAVNFSISLLGEKISDQVFCHFDHFSNLQLFSPKTHTLKAIWLNTAKFCI